MKLEYLLQPFFYSTLCPVQAEFSGPMTRGFKFDATKLELATARLKQVKLNQAKQAWMLRRTKNRVIADQLPKKTDQVVFCALSLSQHK
jgi:hypothetical protein